jgi:alpha-mannosidase
VGILGGNFSLASSSSEDVSIEAVKQAEDSDEVVVRLNELAGRNHPGVQIKFAAPILSAREIDGQERTIGKADVEAGVIHLDVNPYEPRAFAVKLGKPLHDGAPERSVPLALPFNMTGVSSGFGSHDAQMNEAGESIPGDLLPSELTASGVLFKLGPKGRPNMLSADGQSIKLPAGSHRKLVLLGSSVGGDSHLELSFGGEKHTVLLQKWDGMIGQSDSRDWGGVVPELTYDWHNPMVGLEPGFIKRQPVIWYADHKRKADGSDDIYSFCYLFKSELLIPDGASEVTLGSDPSARIAAMTVVVGAADAAVPSTPLYDVLEHGNVDGPSITVAEPIANAEKMVTVMHPLYWSSSNPMHYTLDGSSPNVSSPIYNGPFPVGKSCKVRVATLDATGKILNESSEDVTVHATVAPAVTSAVAFGLTVKLKFSEPVDRASAENAGNYSPAPSGTVTRAKLSEVGETVLLSVSGSPTAVAIKGVQDAGGLSANSVVPVAPLAPVFKRSAEATFDGKGRGVEERNADLPVSAGARWTINLFTKVEAQPGELTILGGFGDGDDSNGTERFLVARHGRLYFWGSNIDIDSGVAFQLGKLQMWTVTYDGKTVRIFADGKLVKSEAAELSDAEAVVHLAPRPAWSEGHRFSGQLSGVTIWDEALPEAMVQELTKR